MIEIWMVRHGETIFNVKKIVQGWSDSPLTKNGIDSTIDMGKIFLENKLKFNGLYSSDLTRSIETAEIIKEVLKLEFDIKIDKRLREIIQESVRAI